MNSAVVARTFWGFKSLWSEQQIENFCESKRKAGMNLSELVEIAMRLYQEEPEKSFTIFRYIGSDMRKNTKSFAKSLEKECLLQLSLMFLKKAILHEQWESLYTAKLSYNLFSQENSASSQESILLKANFYFYNGELNEALQLMRNTIQCYYSECLVGSYMLLTQIYFAKRQYEKALEQLKKWLKTDKDLPLKARLAMAYCYFNLNKFDMAELCFKRILKIDESCVEALIGLAIISERNEEYQNYFEYLEAAKDISNNHPLVLLHLAEHYLMLKDTSRVKSLARKGLKAIKGMARIRDCSEQYRNDYYEYEGRFQNLLGQSYHIEGNFRKALFQYLRLKKKKTLCSGWNRVQEMQCYAALGDFKNAQKTLDVHLTCSNYLGQLNKDSRMFYDIYNLIAYIIGRAESTIQNLKKGEYYFSQALRFNKEDIFLRCQFAHFLSSNNEFEKAKNQYELLLQQMRTKQYEICPQMYNNFGVLLLEIGDYLAASKYFEEALESIRRQELWENDKKGLYIVVLYNSGICAQMRNIPYTAIEKYKQTLQINQYFTDSYLRLAHVHWQLGHMGEYQIVMNQSQRNRSEQLKLNNKDRITIVQVYYDLLNLEYDNARKKLNTLTQDTLYKQLFSICLSYQALDNNHNDFNTKLSILSQRKRECERICNRDSQCVFSVYVLWILTLKIMEMNPGCLKISIAEHKAYEVFQGLQQNINAKCAAQVSYNMALYSMRVGRLDGAVSVFKQIKHHDEKGISDMISVCQMLGGLTSYALKTTKINVFLNPADAKIRYRMHYLILRRCRQESGVDLSSKRQRSQVFLYQAELLSTLRCFRYLVGIDIDRSNIVRNQSENKRIQSLKLKKMKNHIVELLPEVERLCVVYERLKREAESKQTEITFTIRKKNLTLSLTITEQQSQNNVKIQQEDLSLKRQRPFGDEEIGQQPTKKKIIYSDQKSQLIQKIKDKETLQKTEEKFEDPYKQQTD